MTTKFLGSFVLAFVLSVLSLSSYCREAKLIAVAEVWCPYVCEPSADKPGYLVDILEEIFQKQNIAIEHRLLPWRRAVYDTEKGITDAAMGAVQGNHGSTILGLENLGFDETVFVVRKHEHFEYIGPEALNEKSLAVIAEYTYDNNGRLDKYLSQRKSRRHNFYVVHQEKPIESLFEMLLSGRIDTFPENKNVARYFASNKGLLDVVDFVVTDAKDSIYIAFTPSTKGKNYRDLLDAGIQELRKNGRLSEILDTYGLK